MRQRGSAGSRVTTVSVTTAPRLAAALDAAVPHVYLAASLAFLTAAALRLAGGTGALSTTLLRCGTQLRIPASGLLCVGALAHLVADWAAAAAVAAAEAARDGDGNTNASSQPPSSSRPPPPPTGRPRHVLDWPAAYTNVASCGCYLLGSTAIAVGGRVGIPLGSVGWLVGSALAAVQAVLLLAVEVERAGALRAVAAARARASLSRSASEPSLGREGDGGVQAPQTPTPTAPQQQPAAHNHACRCRRGAFRCGRRLRPVSPLPVAVSIVFLTASLLFVSGSAIYLARQAAPFQLPAEGCFAAGSGLFIAGTLAAGGCAGAAPAVAGLINRHRRGALSAAPAGADEEAAVSAPVADLLAAPVLVDAVAVATGGDGAGGEPDRVALPADALAASATTTVAAVAER